MNKSAITNIVSLLAMAAGWYLEQNWLWVMGLFAFSGAITNWLAIHMLFEKVPLLYGSGVIPARFEALKLALHQLVMEQFFSEQHLKRLLPNDAKNTQALIDLKPVIASIDLSPAFDALLDTVQKSSLGGMLAMFGGAQMLLPLKQPFIDNLSTALVTLAEGPAVQEQLRNQLNSAEQQQKIQQQISGLVEARLAELTPQLVKELMQRLIAEHLGWLVVWGGVFGAVIGLLSVLITVA